MDLPRIAALLVPFLGDATLTDAQLSQLSIYLDLLLRWNARVNLTAVRDPEQIVARHFGESLFTARSLYPRNWPLATDHWLFDLGSGAGFPGLPIKIWVPALRLTLIESQYRKATFLREVIRALALPAADVFPARAEEFHWTAAQQSASEVAPPLSRPGKLAPNAELRKAERARQGGDVPGVQKSRIGSLGAPAPNVPRAPGVPSARGCSRAGVAAPSPATIVNRQPAIGNLTVTLRAVEKFDRILPTAARLLAAAPTATRRLALLISDAQVSRARHLAPNLTWSDPIPVPQSSHRVLLIGVHTAS